MFLEIVDGIMHLWENEHVHDISYRLNLITAEVKQCFLETQHFLVD